MRSTAAFLYPRIDSRGVNDNISEGLMRGNRRYLMWVKIFPLRPLRSEADLEKALDVMNRLLDHGKLDPGEEDYLDVLGDLIVKYEKKNHPIPSASESEMLRFLVEGREVTQSRVAEETKIAGSTISRILSGKRRMTRDHIERLSRYFRVSPAVFMEC
jgi:HTH-type transcriptional regulator/antitoxin HigA